MVTPAKERSQRREEMAREIGFDAYGTAQDMPDPIANAIYAILDHLHAQDARLEAFARRAGRGRRYRAADRGLEGPEE